MLALALALEEAVGEMELVADAVASSLAPKLRLGEALAEILAETEALEVALAEDDDELLAVLLDDGD